jgi:replicative DNA helicase
MIAAGAAGQGSTALAVNVAAHVALQVRAPIVVASLDLAPGEMSMRLLASVARVSRLRLMRRELDQQERARLVAARSLMHNAPVSLSRLLQPDVPQVLASLAAVTESERARLVIVESATDMLTLLHGDEREDATGELVRGLKALARRYDATLLATWRLRSDLDVDWRGAHALGDFVGTAVEDADVVACVDRPDLRVSGLSPTLEVSLFKNRHGSCQPCEFAFLADSGTVLNLAAN